MPTQGRDRHAVRAQHQLLVGRKDDERVIARERRLRVEGQEGVEDRQRPLRHAEARAGDADGAEDFPLVYNFFRRPLEATTCAATCASVSDRRPKGAVGRCTSMFLASSWAKKNLLAKSAPELLTVIREAPKFRTAKYLKRGSRSGDVSGAFFFARLFSCGFDGFRLLEGLIECFKLGRNKSAEIASVRRAQRQVECLACAATSQRPLAGRGPSRLPPMVPAVAFAASADGS